MTEECDTLVIDEHDAARQGGGWHLLAWRIPPIHAFQIHRNRRKVGAHDGHLPTAAAPLQPDRAAGAATRGRALFGTRPAVLADEAAVAALPRPGVGSHQAGILMPFSLPENVHSLTTKPGPIS